MANLDDAAYHAKRMLEALGLSAEVDPQLDRTPKRFTDFLAQTFSKVGRHPPKISKFQFQPGYDEYREVPMYGECDDFNPVITITNISFSSLCVHHLLPFFGTIDIAIVPCDYFAGFGSFARVVDWASGQPQVQERMTEQIAATIDEQLEPVGLIVRSTARQMCVEMRGRRHQSTYTVHASRGHLAPGGGNPNARNTAMMELNRKSQV